MRRALINDCGGGALMIGPQAAEVDQLGPLLMALARPLQIN